jgi:creatinine amidohydrolase
MLVRNMNWMQIEDYLKTDDRAVFAIGSTEQHAYLSMLTDSILSSRVAEEAAEPLGVPVFPTVSYGLSPYFTAYPGSVALKSSTLNAIVTDILDCLRKSGFRRVLIVNGHGGNDPTIARLREYMTEHPDITVRFHSWFKGPRVWARAMEIDNEASHASWMENFPWTRLPGVEFPDGAAKMLDYDLLYMMSAEKLREYAGDGNWGGVYQRSDEEMLDIWRIGVEEVRGLIEGPWAP